MTNTIPLGNLLRKQSPEHGLSLIGDGSGYAGEQDGSRNVTTDVMWFISQADASRHYPEVPSYVRLHWAEYKRGLGWYAVFGWNTSQAEPEDGNPLSAI